MGCKDSGRAGRELLKVQSAACKKIELEASCASLLRVDQEAQRGEKEREEMNKGPRAAVGSTGTQSCTVNRSCPLPAPRP